MIIYYAGVGSRSTPPDICALMTRLASFLDGEGWVLRSGGAEGADSAFAAGVSQQAPEIYRPRQDRSIHGQIAVYPDELWEQAKAIAAEVHPAWERCSDYAKRLHTRNVFQVLGIRLTDPRTYSRYLFCWTPDGAETTVDTSMKTGGTGQAIRIATRYNIPVLNLAQQDTYRHVIQTIEEHSHAEVQR